jgi:hypothetical protein
VWLSFTEKGVFAYPRKKGSIKRDGRVFDIEVRSSKERVDCRNVERRRFQSPTKSVEIRQLTEPSVSLHVNLDPAKGLRPSSQGSVVRARRLERLSVVRKARCAIQPRQNQHIGLLVDPAAKYLDGTPPRLGNSVLTLIKNILINIVNQSITLSKETDFVFDFLSENIKTTGCADRSAGANCIS